MPDWIDEALAPYLKRVKAQPGRNDLTRNMNKELRAHPEAVEIIRRTMTRLIEWELLVDLSGQVQFTRMDLYRLLCETEEDWCRELPSVEFVGAPLQPMGHFLQTGEIEVPDEWGPTVKFERKARFMFSVFTAAMSIAKRVGLIQGHGSFGLHPDFLAKLRARRKQRITEPPMLADDLGGIGEAST